MFSRRLILAFAAFALLAVALGALNGWVSRLAEHRVVRGRVAADLLSTYLDLSAEKARLRVWVLQSIADPATDPETGPGLAQSMRRDIETLRGLAAEAARMDGSDPALEKEHVERARTIDLLDSSVASMLNRVDVINDRAGSEGGRIPLSAVDEVFDRYGQYDVRALLNQAIAAETEALRRDRASADESLAQAQAVSNIAASSIVILAVILSVYFSYALRRPLRELTAGAQAFETGDLAYRIPALSKDEFGTLASRMNQMASQIDLTSQRERELRSGLEVMVSERTVDLQAAVADLQRSEARRRQLLADIGHELRTPTTVIRGEAEVALRGREMTDAAYRESLVRIATSAEQLGKQIEDLLTIALDDAEMLTLKTDVVEPELELRRAISQVSTLANLRQVQLVPALQDAEAFVQGDARRLGQIMSVLLDNAIRYSHPGGKVEITTRCGPDGWHLEVRDFGIGIPEEDFPRIFERGFRASSARTHRADGSGLGLSIAKAFAERHGGKLELESVVGQGTTVRLSVPTLALEAA
jgi:two-component system, OmpR family, sensor kinase